MAGPQSRRKGRRSRWTNAEALNRRRGKSPDQVSAGANSRNGKPPEKQAVLKLGELCRAVLDLRSVTVGGAKTGKVTEGGASHLKIKEDLTECLVPVVETATAGNEESEVTHSTVRGIPESSRGLESDNVKIGHSLVKLEIHETKNWNEQNNNFCLQNADLCKVIKTECESDVNGVISCKMETVDHKVEHEGVDHIEENGGTIARAMAGDAEERECSTHQPCYDDKAFSSTVNNVVLHNFSRAEYHCCKEPGSVCADSVNLANQSENSLIPATDDCVFHNISFSGIGYSTEEDAGIGHAEVQELSGPPFWVGKRKHVSHSVTSSLPEELLPALKSDSLKDDISYNLRNCGMVIDSDTDKLFCQEVSDLWSTRSLPIPRYVPPLPSVELPDADACGCVGRAQSWSPALLPASSGGRIGSYLDRHTDSALHCGLKTTDALAGSLHQDVNMLQPDVPASYPAVPISPAAGMPREGTGQGTETFRSQEGELFRRIEESLAERETLKYQEKELLKRIERSLTETQSLKCREEQLLNKIERSLTRAKSLKSQEEELLRRIEVSLAQRGTVKSEDEELLVGMETLKDTKYSFVDVDSVSSMEFESESMPDLENSLPLKKRKKWLRTVTDNESKAIHVRGSQLESFPSFPLWPMISIAELEAVGKLHEHPSLPSFPSRPMMSIAELEAHAAFGKLQHLPRELPAPWMPRYPYYCGENSFCGESFYSEKTVGRMYREFFDQDGEVTENMTVFPVIKTEESTERYSCCGMGSDCAVLQSGAYDLSYLRKVEACSDQIALSVCSGVAEDSKVGLSHFVGPSADSVGGKVEVAPKCGVEPCKRTGGASVGLCTVGMNSRDVVETKVNVRGLECSKGNSVGNEVTVRVPECTKDYRLVGMNARNYIEVSGEVEMPVELKCIKVEPDFRDGTEHCAILCPPLTDLKYKADVECNDNAVLVGSSVNSAADAECMACTGLENNIELLGESEESSKKAKDSVEWCGDSDVPLKEAKCVVGVGSEEGLL